MRKTIAGSAFLGVALFLGPFTTGAWAQSKPSTEDGNPPVVSGQVIGEDGALVPGATVMLWGINNTQTEPHNARKTTDADGKYQIRGLPPGEYMIEAKADEYQSVKRRISLGTTKETLTQDFTMPVRAVLIKTDWPWPRTGIDLTLLQPAGYVFFDTGQDEDGEVDFFDDGKLQTSVQLVGVDWVAWYDKELKFRTGINTGLGLTTVKEKAPTATNPDATEDAAGVLVNISGFLDVLKFARLEYGWAMGISARERGENASFDDADDRGLYLAISLRTKLGDQLMKVFR